MRIVTYNIQYGFGEDRKFDLERIAREIHGADIIALQEVERFWTRSNNTDQMAFFADYFPNHYSVYGPGVDIHIQESTSQENRRRQFGNMILSKYPIEYTRNHLLPKRSSIGQPLSIQRTALEATLLVNAIPIRIYSVHLTHLSRQIRKKQIKRLLEIHHDAVDEGFPLSFENSGFSFEMDVPDRPVADKAILLGDFNFAPDHPEYEKIVGPVSEYGGHVISENGFVDAWTQVGKDLMAGETGHTLNKYIRMDYCFVSSTLRNLIKSCWVNTHARGSDHLPVWIELDI
ncbi:MAG: endonuclease/exonuclease/phosphatase family protein [Gammaproteobacteria bacterium]|nr:endonuclease/exonuclease/phosphatase family protein [Gammaproteobacteria bacterium]MCY4217686.1 endonuclease/exonuclease/phosphatase family protein [Gammaproteobacteria bacterium]